MMDIRTSPLLWRTSPATRAMKLCCGTRTACGSTRKTVRLRASNSMRRCGTLTTTNPTTGPTPYCPGSGSAVPFCREFAINRDIYSGYFYFSAKTIEFCPNSTNSAHSQGINRDFRGFRFSPFSTKDLPHFRHRDRKIIREPTREFLAQTPVNTAAHWYVFSLQVNTCSSDQVVHSAGATPAWPRSCPDLQEAALAPAEVLGERVRHLLCAHRRARCSCAARRSGHIDCIDRWLPSAEPRRGPNSSPRPRAERSCSILLRGR